SKQRRLLGIESAGEKIQRDPKRIFAQRFRIAQASKRVVIGDEIKRFAYFLELDRGAHHAEIIANVQDAAGLNAGQDSHASPTLNAQRPTFNVKMNSPGLSYCLGLT